MGAYLSGADLSGACLRGARLAGADLRNALLRGALCEETRFLNCQLDYVDFRWSELNNVDLSSAGCVRGADFTGAIYPDTLRASLLGRSFQELDCWNPLTRRTISIQSILRSGNHPPSGISVAEAIRLADQQLTQRQVATSLPLNRWRFTVATHHRAAGPRTTKQPATTWSGCHQLRSHALLASIYRICCSRPQGRRSR